MVRCTDISDDGIAVAVDRQESRTGARRRSVGLKEIHSPFKCPVGIETNLYRVCSVVGAAVSAGGAVSGPQVQIRVIGFEYGVYVDVAMRLQRKRMG